MLGLREAWWGAGQSNKHFLTPFSIFPAPDGRQLLPPFNTSPLQVSLGPGGGRTMESLQLLRILPEVCKQLNMIQQKCICRCLARPCGNFFKTSPSPSPIHYLCIRGSVVL